MTYAKPRKLCADWGERTNRNEHSYGRGIFTFSMDSPRDAAGQSPVAINALCRRGRAPHPGAAKEPRAGALLALADGIGEVLHSVFAADCHGQPPGIIKVSCHNRTRSLLCDAGDQPAFCAGVCCAHCLYGLRCCSPSSANSLAPCVALGLRWRASVLVVALAACDRPPARSFAAASWT